MAPTPTRAHAWADLRVQAPAGVDRLLANYANAYEACYANPYGVCDELP
jgi:hypothetical protein